MAETSQTLPSDTQLFRDIFTASPVGIAIEDLEGQPLFVNPALCSMLGFSEEELCTKHCVQFSPPEDAEKDWTLFQQLRAGLIDHYQLEKRYFRRDGSLLWGQLSVSLLNGWSSPLVVAMAEDITEKKKAEEARFRHSAIIESSEDAIASVTLDGFITSWNPGAQRMFGYTESEAVGRSATILVPPELPDEENKILETLRAGGRIEQLETVRITKTGKRINVSLSISPIKNSTGETVGCSGIARDITERKRREEKLQEYERAVEHSGEMITVIDREYRCVMANRQYLSLKNLSRDRVVGHFAYELLDQATFEQVAKPKLDESFRGKVVKYQLKYTYPKIGERVLSISYFPIEGPNGVDRVTCLLQDITDRIQAEQTLADMTRKLVEAQEQERARIARELHDDINQRLAMLSIQVMQLLEEPSEIEVRVRQLRSQIAEITSDLQALSHDLHTSKLEYLGVVPGIKSWCREFGERHGMEIDFSGDVLSPIPLPMGVSLFRVLQEALQNTIKHSEVKRAEVRLREESGQLYLLVSDSGAGFDVGEAMRGRGLGLTSMRERVRLVNGTIAIESKPMQGTSIRVSVPLESEHGSKRAAM